MNRKMLLGAGLAGVSLLAIPSVVLAQVPPDPPATFYGSATGGSPGQGVIAIVVNGSTSTVCGRGLVQSDAPGPLYGADASPDPQRTGCGPKGRQIRVY